jgi:hypothetical protein
MEFGVMSFSGLAPAVSSDVRAWWLPSGGYSWWTLPGGGSDQNRLNKSAGGPGGAQDLVASSCPNHHGGGRRSEVTGLEALREVHAAVHGDAPLIIIVPVHFANLCIDAKLFFQ